MKQKRNLITIDLSNCKNWKECQKVIEMVHSGKIKINVTSIK
jgi:hypothetical protein